MFSSDAKRKGFQFSGDRRRNFMITGSRVRLIKIHEKRSLIHHATTLLVLNGDVS